MKVERKEVEPVFVPVVLSLESQREVDLLFALFAASSSVVDAAFGLNSDFSYDLYCTLKMYASDTLPYPKVTIMDNILLKKC